MNLRHPNRSWRRSPLFVFPLLMLVGCSPAKDDSVPAAVVPEDQANVIVILENEQPSDAQQQAMLAAKESLFQKLSGRLMEAMTTQGPAAAIVVCQQEAPQIAKSVSDEQGVRIGRTGVRLRNPTNQPPTWAASLVESRVDTPTFVRLSNNHSAALLPIKLQSQCLMCHGPADQVLPEVQSQLAKLYPTDQATGFQEGELRGWFWVELPD